MTTNNHNQVISKKRVTDHGEVLTAEREVNAMMDLVRHETERIESRFLEPACGTGNFLAPILEKKLDIIKNKYSKSQLEFERYAIIAIGSIYGVELLEDNVIQCRQRLFDIFNQLYTNLYKEKCKESCKKSAMFILNMNILRGDALTLKTVTDKPRPIVFAEWSSVNGSMIKRRDYMFAELIHDHSKNPTLFSQAVISDTGETHFQPKAIKEYPLIHFLELNHEDSNKL